MDHLLIQEIVRRLDTAKNLDSEAAWNLLRPLGVHVVTFLNEFYPNAKKSQGRRSLVYHALRYARISEEAFKLGLLALADKATMVRYEACGLCAYSLRKEAIPYLEKLLNHSDLETVQDAKAAIDAIKHKNHHYFRDRTHTGRIFWEVNPGDSGS